jgi:hypothetical protein
MSIRIFFTVFAVLSGLFGLGFVFVPGAVLANYGIDTTPQVAIMSRLFGGTLIAVSLIQWLARDLRDQSALRAVLISLGVSSVVGLVVSIAGTTAGTVNALGWSTVVIYLLSAAGCGYFLMTGARQ